MARNFIALLLMLMLVGCSGNRFWATILGDDNYDFYRDGKLACKEVNRCRMRASSGKEMLLEVRKGDVVYGHMLVLREYENNYKGRMERDFEKSVSDMQGYSDMLFKGPLMLGYLWNSIISVRSFKELPEYITIPVGSDDKASVPYPWDKPAKN
jgi:hypothetical protein